MSMGYEPGTKTKKRCPRCRSRTFETAEVFEEVVFIQVTDGVFANEATDHQAGDIIGISARCSACKHQWTPRGAKSLTDFFDDPK